MGKKQKQLSPEEQRERAEARRVANGLADGKLEATPFNGTCNKCGKQGHRAADCKGAGEGDDNAKVGKGHKQRGAGAVLTAKGPIETKSGVVKKDWQRLPTQLLHEFCQREKRPKPIYHAPREVSKNGNGKRGGAAAADDDEEEEDWKKYIKPPADSVVNDDDEPKQYRQRVMLPDPKFKERSLTFCPSQASPTKELAKEHTALLALLHVCGDLPLERKLPDEFREVWIASQSKDKTAAPTKANATSNEKNKKSDAVTAVGKSSKDNNTSVANATVNISKASKTKEASPSDGSVQQTDTETTSSTAASITSSQAMSLSADSKFASQADRRLHQMKKNQEQLDRQRRREAIEKANADPSVLMSNKMRVMIELALGIQSGEKKQKSCLDESQSMEEKETSQNRDNDKAKHAKQNTRNTNPASKNKLAVALVDEVPPYGFTKLDLANVLTFLDGSVDNGLMSNVDDFSITEAMSPNEAGCLFILSKRLQCHIASLKAMDLKNIETNHDEAYAENIETELMILESMYADCFSRIEIDGFGSIVTISPDDLPIMDMIIPSHNIPPLVVNEASAATTNHIIQENTCSRLPPVFLVRGISMSSQVEVARKYLELLSLAVAENAATGEPPSVLADMFNYISEVAQKMNKLHSSSSHSFMIQPPTNDDTLMESLVSLGPSPLMAPGAGTSQQSTDDDSNDNCLSDITSNTSSLSIKDESLQTIRDEKTKKSDGNMTNKNSKSTNSRSSYRKGFWDMGNVGVSLESEKVPFLIKSSRQSLPASKAKDEILKTLNDHQTILIAGGTGCGKTTQVPQFILEAASESKTGKHVKIVVAQPRRIAAIGVATRVHEEMGEASSGLALGAKGSKVGYMVRGDSKVSADSCSLLFCTTGVLLQRMKSDHNLDKITHLIVDEVHERHVDADFLLAALKRILLERPDMKLIMMSATIDTNKFSKYFPLNTNIPSSSSSSSKSSSKSKGLKQQQQQQAVEGCPIITIPGFAHPVTSFYLEDVSELTGLVPRNLAISNAARLKPATVSDKSSVKSTLPPSSSNTLKEKEIKENQVREDWESMDVNNVDIDIDDDEEEDDEEEAEDNNEQSSTSSKFPDPSRFGEVSKSVKKGSEMGGSIDAAVTCDCKLIQSLIYKVISQAMHKSGSFLVFLPGVGEISKLCDVLNGKNGRRNKYNNGEEGGVGEEGLANGKPFKNFDPSVKLLVLPLHGGLSPRDQLEVFKSPKKGVIKVVVATNIAETSITIPDCTVVIDSARVKQTGFDAARGSSYLALDWAAKDALNQRKGRAGRVAPGICFRLVPKKLFDWLPDHTVPEISRIPLEELVLLVKASGFGNPQRFLATFLDPPPVNAITSAVTALKELQALAPPSTKGSGGGGLELTSLGRHLCQLPCSASIGKLLVMGALLNVLEPVLNIAAAISVRSPLNSLQAKNKAAMMLKRKREYEKRINRNLDGAGSSATYDEDDDDLFEEMNRVDEATNRLNLQKLSNCGRSDHCFIAAVVDCWLVCGSQGTSKSGGRKELCEGLGLSYIKMVEIEQLRHQYKEALADLGFHVHDFKQRSDQSNSSAASASSSLEALKSYKELGFKSVMVVRRSLNEWRVINAVLLSSLWPNVVKIKKPIQKYHDTAQGALEAETDVKELKFEIQRGISGESNDERMSLMISASSQQLGEKGKQSLGGKGGGKGQGGIGGGGGAVSIRMQTTELVAIHPSSLLFKENKYASPWLVFSECITTSRKFLCSTSECAPYAILLFGGKLNVTPLSSTSTAISIETPLYKSIIPSGAATGDIVKKGGGGGDGNQEGLTRAEEIKHEVLKWCRVQAPPEVATLVQHLRVKMDELLEAKIANPSLSIHEDEAMIAMVRLLITEGLG